jgi:hypothetical protein
VNDREHWHGEASVGDDGTLTQPAVFGCGRQPAPELDVPLLDRTRYRGPVFRAGRWIPGETTVQFWGRDREQVLAATRQRFAAELTR